MKVILRERIKGLGEDGDVVEVAPGYARHLLIPRQMAVEATPANLERRNAARNRVAREEQREAHRAQESAAKLDGQIVTVGAKAGASGRLFGSVTTQDVCDAIARQYSVEVDRRRVDMPEPLKSLGDHRVAVQLHAGVVAYVYVRIQSD